MEVSLNVNDSLQAYWFNMAGDPLTPEELNKDGTPTEDAGVCFLVSRDQNPKYMRQLEKTRFEKGWNKPRKAEKAKLEETMASMINACAREVLHDWRGLENGGKPLDGTDYATKVSVLTANPNILMTVMGCAGDMETHVKLARDVEVGKLPPSSSGTASTPKKK